MENIIQKLLEGRNSRYLFSTHGSVRLIYKENITIKMFKTLGAKQTVLLDISKSHLNNIGLMDYLGQMADSEFDIDGDYKLAELALSEVICGVNNDALKGSGAII